MGLFTSLFGSSGSDKADKLRQQAIDAFGAIKTPELSALQVQLDKYVQAGKITPEEAEATLLNSNAFNSIKTDPSLVGAQKQALQQLQDTANEGGLTAIDKSRLQDITDRQNQEARSGNEAIMQNAQARGVGSSDLSTVNQLINSQSAADRASRAGTDVAAQAQARALQALQAAGQLGGQMEAQQFGEGAQKAQAQNAIDAFNAQTQNQFNLTNTLAANQAQYANLENAQDIANKNTSTQNQGKIYNSGMVQQQFQDELAKAQGKAGTLNSWAGDAQKQSQNEAAADMALTGQLINAGATAAGGAFGGGAGAGGAGAGSSGMASSSAVNGGAPFKTYAPSMAEMGFLSHGGEVKKPGLEDEYNDFVQRFCNGGTVKMADGGSVTIRPANMKKGGKVPGVPKVPGDSIKNDTVPAMLSPGEVVLPRSVAQHPERIPTFMEHTGIEDPTKNALRKLQIAHRGGF